MTAPTSYPRFAIVTANASGVTRWQIHTSGCPDAGAAIREGTFVEFVSSRSAEDLIAEEIAVHKNKGATEDDFQIMPCCRVPV